MRPSWLSVSPESDFQTVCRPPSVSMSHSTFMSTKSTMLFHCSAPESPLLSRSLTAVVSAGIWYVLPLAVMVMRRQ